jgi:hypothetical protein
MAHFGPAVMRVAVEARIPDLLVESPQGLSVAKLAEKTSIDSRKLRKVLRALAARHCFHEGACISGHTIYVNAHPYLSSCTGCVRQ